ncbi:hypothetical protein F511_36485 [Dorcoceras hygrometricum]|uniref:Uncharacterized protein n=1 Tax=Dorcoceras hygrometricum TaxID=472368 RepID=A0A2Z7B5W3_9LAMI|nr:hypothetical protein F511_36485 [Dorcoceras hygrometricum]
MENSEMVAMFEALVASGLNGFLGCMSHIYETSLINIYQNASVREDKVVSTVQGKLVEISEEVFARTFQLRVEGLIDINEARTEFSFTGEKLSTSCKKRELKIEYRLLSDIVAKSITVKTVPFNAVTHERFLLMTAIFGGVSVNWGRLLFKIFKDMVTPETRQDRGCGNKRTLKVKATPSKAKLDLVSVTLDAEPIQTADPTSADDVNTIIEQVIAETAQMETTDVSRSAVGDQEEPKADEMEQWFNLSYEDFIASDANKRVETASDTDGEPEIVVEKQPVQQSTVEELMSLDPSRFTALIRLVFHCYIHC